MGTTGKLAYSRRVGYSYENHTYFSMQMLNSNEGVFNVKSSGTNFIYLKF